MQEYKGKPVEYLGDGVYALYDGLSIWLHANDHINPTDRVYLEPSVLRALNRFAVDAPKWAEDRRHQGIKKGHKESYGDQDG